MSDPTLPADPQHLDAGSVRATVVRLDARIRARWSPIIENLPRLGQALVLLYGGWRVMQGEMTIGVLTAFLLYLRMFFEPMQEISQFYNTFQSASAALEKLAGVLEEEPSVPEPVDPIDNNEPVDPRDSSDPSERRDSTESAIRGPAHSRRHHSRQKPP